MLRRLLAGLSIASLLVGLILLVFWWRSFHHVDHFTFGNIETKQTTYTTSDGKIAVKVTENVGGMILSRSSLFPFWRVAGGCLWIPAVWVAMTVRRRLPRPGGREVNPGRNAATKR